MGLFPQIWWIWDELVVRGRSEDTLPPGGGLLGLRRGEVVKDQAGPSSREWRPAPSVRVRAARTAMRIAGITKDFPLSSGSKG